MPLKKNHTPVYKKMEAMIFILLFLYAYYIINCKIANPEWKYSQKTAYTLEGRVVCETMPVKQRGSETLEITTGGPNE
jgi:hypothetical protein